jgi:hypothetical protein
MQMITIYAYTLIDYILNTIKCMNVFICYIQIWKHIHVCNSIIKLCTLNGVSFKTHVL